MADTQADQQMARAPATSLLRVRRECPTCGDSHTSVLQGTTAVVRRCRVCRTIWIVACEVCFQPVTKVEERVYRGGEKGLQAVCGCGHTRHDWKVQKLNGKGQRRQQWWTGESPADIALEVADFLDVAWKEIQP